MVSEQGISQAEWIWALRETDLDTTVKLTGVMLASWGYVTTGRNAFPSRGTLAKNVGKHPSTIKRALSRLLAAGWIAIEAEPVRGRKPTTYRLTVPVEMGSPMTPLTEETSSTDPAMGSPMTPSWGHPCPPHGVTHDPYTETETQTETETSKSPVMDTRRLVSPSDLDPAPAEDEDRPPAEAFDPWTDDEDEDKPPAEAFDPWTDDEDEDKPLSPSPVSPSERMKEEETSSSTISSPLHTPPVEAPPVKYISKYINRR